MNPDRITDAPGQSSAPSPAPAGGARPVGPAPADAAALVKPPLAKIPGWLMRLGISAWMLIGILLLAAAVYVGLAQIRALVAPLVVAVVMGMLFYPLVDRLSRFGMGRALAASVILLGLAVIVAVSMVLAVRGVFDQGTLITQQLEQGWLRIQEWLADLGVDVSQIQDAIASLGSNAGGALSNVVTATVSSLGFFLVGLFIGTFILYYLLKDWDLVTSWAATHIGLPQDLGKGLLEDATQSIRQYFYALTLTSIPIAITIGLAMWLLGLPLAFTIALVTFVTAYIPYLGAIFSGAFATLIALGSGGVTEALIVLGVVLFTQNVMQTLLLTRLASSQLHIHPIVNLASTIVGASLAGILGATLSAPFVASVIAAQRRLATYRWNPGSDTVPPPAAGPAATADPAADQ